MSFLVPNWSFIGDSSRKDEILDWFEDSGAYFPKFISENFKETVDLMIKKGWGEKKAYSSSLSENHKNIKKDFFSVCVSKHLERSGVLRAIYNTVKPLSIDRFIRTDEDYKRMFDDWISHLNDENLAKVMNSEEICTGRGAIHMWYSEDLDQLEIMEKICKNLITIGDGDEFTIDTSEEKGDIVDILETYFLENYKRSKV